MISSIIVQHISVAKRLIYFKGFQILHCCAPHSCSLKQQEGTSTLVHFHRLKNHALRYLQESRVGALWSRHQRQTFSFFLKNSCFGRTRLWVSIEPFISAFLNLSRLYLKRTGTCFPWYDISLRQNAQATSREGSVWMHLELKHAC